MNAMDRMRIHGLVVVAWAAVVALDCAQAFDASVRASPASLRLKGGGVLVARATSAELHNAAYELSGKVHFPPLHTTLHALQIEYTAAAMSDFSHWCSHCLPLSIHCCKF